MWCVLWLILPVLLWLSFVLRATISLFPVRNLGGAVGLKGLGKRNMEARAG
jgi:hypothetical protein